MIISNQFNRFYRAILKDFYDKALFKGYIGSQAKFKEVLCYSNYEYPRDSFGNLASTKVISNKQLVQHIEFMTIKSTEWGIELDYVAKEWQHLLEMYK